MFFMIIMSPCEYRKKRVVAHPMNWQLALGAWKSPMTVPFFLPRQQVPSHPPEKGMALQGLQPDHVILSTFSWTNVKFNHLEDLGWTGARSAFVRDNDTFSELVRLSLPYLMWFQPTMPPIFGKRYNHPVHWTNNWVSITHLFHQRQRT